MEQQKIIYRTIKFPLTDNVYNPKLNHTTWVMTDTVNYAVWIETMPGWDDITGCSQKNSKHIIIPVLQSEAKTSAARARYLSHTESPLKFPSTSINTFRSEWSPLKRIWLAWKMGKQKKIEKVNYSIPTTSNWRTQNDSNWHWDNTNNTDETRTLRIIPTSASTPTLRS
jgi:hypothetical protein